MLRRGPIRIASGFAALVILASTSFALATEVSRDSYRAAVEPICKANTVANERILKGVKAEVKQGRLRPAARQFSKAAQALKKTLAELQAVPRPAADQARLAKWLGDVRTEAELFARVAEKLRAGAKAGAQEVVIRLTHNATLANNVALPFEFRYCRFEPSRFT